MAQAIWTSSTAQNTAISQDLQGYDTVEVSLQESGSVTGGQINFEISDDGGTSWFGIQGTRIGFFFQDGFYLLTSPVPVAWQFSVSGFNRFRVRLSTQLVGSGSASISLNTGFGVGTMTVVCGSQFGTNFHTTLDDAAGSNPVNTTVKGTQGARALAVQDYVDSGRSYLSFSAAAAAGVIAEALLTVSQTKQGVVTTGVTSYTVTSGKTLRITSISVSVRSAAAAVAFARLALRHNPTGATVVTSPIAYLVPEVNSGNATSGSGAAITIPIPDGIEFYGNGTQTIGISHLDQATTNILNVAVYGFEY